MIGPRSDWPIVELYRLCVSIGSGDLDACLSLVVPVSCLFVVKGRAHEQCRRISTVQNFCVDPCRLAPRSRREFLKKLETGLTSQEMSSWMGTARSSLNQPGRRARRTVCSALLDIPKIERSKESRGERNASHSRARHWSSCFSLLILAG